MSRFVIVGAGAVGALLAAQLHQGGIDTVLVARGENLEVIRRNGLTIHRPDRTEVIQVPVVGSPDDVGLRPDDILVVATKAQDADSALGEWAWRPVADGGLAADLPVVTIHNGLAAENMALRRFARLHAATMWIAASHLSAGEVVSPSWPVVGIVWIGPLGRALEAESSAIAAQLRLAGYLAHEVPDIAGVKAHKLLGNLSNALDLFEGDSAEIDAARAAISAEAVAVYDAAGIDVVDPSTLHPASLTQLDIRPVSGQVNGRRSTWQSFARGSSSEVDYLNGEIVLLGRVHGIPTPVNERIQRVLGELAVTGGGARPRDIATLREHPTPSLAHHTTH
ncbi:MAG TPA: 2-dehydropantoate 2-reductase N-terminal domain-containing protein [Pseudolysinimonas sp.]|nr:2-dehydropantoate 2-reductase N-terminal domain-containing protein [Pseudolysinimonas sp.]